MNKKLVFLCLFLFGSLLLSAQMTQGSTGLLSSPSAEMQKDGTVMVGGNYLNSAFIVSAYNHNDYNSYNYFVNVTFLPFLEASYTCNLLRGTKTFVPNKIGKIVNQDRSFSVRLRVLKESKYIPAVVIGSNDLYSQITGSNLIIGGSTNQFFNRFYLATTKHFILSANHDIGVHLAYTYSKKFVGIGNSISGGITYNPGWVPNLRVIAQYDRESVSVGANYLLLKHFFLQAVLQDGKYFSGGIIYKAYLKK